MPTLIFLCVGYKGPVKEHPYPETRAKETDPAPQPTQELKSNQSQSTKANQFLGTKYNQSLNLPQAKELRSY